MKGNIVDSFKTVTSGLFLEDNPQISYTIVKETKYGTFTGTVKVCDEDYNDSISDFSGYAYAERKCDIQILEAKMRMYRERAAGIENAINVLSMKYDSMKNPPKDAEVFLGDLKWQHKLAYRDYTRARHAWKYVMEDFIDYTDRNNAFRLRAIQRKEEIEKKNAQKTSE